jgi:pectinesterase
MQNLYVTENDNLQQILDNLHTPTTIYLKNGTYKQKLVLRSDNVTLIGENAQKTVICNNDYARKPHEDGREYNTFRTYTLCTVGNNIKLQNLTIQNNNTDPKTVGQCVALSVNSKHFYGKNLILRSTQDTLFTSPFPDDLIIRYSGLTDDPTYYDGFIPKDQLYMDGNSLHIFEDCDIYGTVDYIFGCAEAYFSHCKFISTNDGREYGYVAAPAHSLKQDKGYAFIDCEFIKDGALDASVYLARPWRDFGKCDYINCKLDRHISPVLFDKWNDTYRNKTARFGYFNLDCNFEPTPVDWSKKLTKEQAAEIISSFASAKNLLNIK